MATLTFSQIRSHPKATLVYIANPDKMLSSTSHDVYQVLNYMGSPQSVNRTYSFSHHCSQNPEVAEKEMELHRRRYYANKKSAQPHKGELLGLHFFISYSEDDCPTPAVLNDITQSFTEHRLLRDFPAFGADHFDKEHRHAHLYISQFSAVGKPRKMCLRHADIDELKRHLNRLCVGHGLSVIDTKALRADQEYSDWLDGIIAEGKVVVHPEKNEPKTRRRKNTPAANYYYKWQKQCEEQAVREDLLLSEAQRRKKNFENKFCCSFDENPTHRWYVTGDPQNRFYAVPRVSTDGYRRTPLELMLSLLSLIAQNEGAYIKQNDPVTWLKYHATVDTHLQGMIDCLTAARTLNVSNLNDIPKRLSDVGRQMNAIRRETIRHAENINKYEQAHTPTNCNENSKPSSANMPTDEQRYIFAKQKLSDYDKRMKELKKHYHDLKRLEALSFHIHSHIQKIYRFSETVLQQTAQQSTTDIDQLIRNAKVRADEGNTLRHSQKRLQEQTKSA